MKMRHCWGWFYFLYLDTYFDKYRCMNNVLPFISSIRFWKAYFWIIEEEKEYPELKEPLFLPVSNEYYLVLDMEDFGYISLSLRGSNKEEAEIAWDDEGHFHPYVLRMEEWLKLTKQIAANLCTGQWIPALLLCRFVGLEQVVSEKEEFLFLIRKFSIESGLFGDESETWFLDSEFYNRLSEDMDAKWENRNNRWYYVGEDAYSLRNPDNDGFPFSQWEELLMVV